VERARLFAQTFKMYIKIHNSYRKVIALCDSNMIGKTFEEEKLQLKITESFFKGEEVSKEQVIKILQKEARDDSTFNIVGEESISLAVKIGLIKKENIGKISNVPYALVF